MNKAVFISIVIPCLNEKDTIAQAIADAKEHATKNFPRRFEIIVADNGSTDGTLDVLKKNKDARLVNVPIRGYGAALHWGILRAKGKYVLFADADLSYPFSNLSRIKKVLESSNPDLALGSRLRGQIQPGAMPLLHRYLGTPVLTKLINWLYHLPTSDCNSGMRVVKKSFYKKLGIHSSGMEWASEVLLKTALQKGEYCEFPIRFQKDKRSRPPHLSTWSDGWRHLKTIILLKPKVFLLFIFLFLSLALLSFNHNFIFTCLFILTAFVSVLNYLALRFMEFALDKRENYFAAILNSNRLVSWIMMITIIIGGLILLIPDDHLGTKMILVSANMLLFIWVFLIETIKTHLINRLP